MPARFDVRVELLLAGSWADVTPDVYTRDTITVRRGASDEATRADYGRATLTFNNRLGLYSPRNPASTFYGLIGRNTPCRVSVQAGDTHLLLPDAAGGGASTPDASALDVTGDIDVRVDVGLDGVGGDPADVVGKWGPAGQRSWRLVTSAAGLPILYWTADGTTLLATSCPVAVPGLITGRRLSLRVTLDADNGAGGRTATWYTGTGGVGGSWTQVGDPVVTAGTTSIHSGTAALEVGDLGDVAGAPASGRVYAVQVRNGIGGTVVASPDFTSRSAGDTSWADSAGRTWTVVAPAKVTDRRIRMAGEVVAWPARWDLSGADRWVPVEVAGITRRLRQGASPLQSTLRRRIPTSTSLVAYWPCEDGDTATVAASPVDGVPPMSVSGWSFAAADGPGGSDRLPTVGNPGYMHGRVPAYTGTGEWRVELLYKLDAMPGTLCALVDVRATGTVVLHRVLVTTNNVRLRGYDRSGTQVYESSTTAPDFTGAWTRLEVSGRQSGGTVDMTLRWTVVGGTNWNQAPSYTGTAGVVTGVSSNFGSEFATDLQGLGIGHVVVLGDADDDVYESADHGFTDESATARVLRVCAERDVPAVVAGGASYQFRCGPQRSEAFLAVLEAAAAVGGGLLHERRDSLGLRYRARDSLYNQPPALELDYTAGHVSAPFEPTEDDEHVRNDVTVTRQGGSQARRVVETGPLSVLDPPDGVGRYDTSLTLDLADDGQPDPHASWAAHEGTWDEARYPLVRLDLTRNGDLVDTAVDVDVLDRVTISDLPAWLPPGGADLLVRGYEERISPVAWDVVLNCTPAGPYEVGVWEDDVLGRLDTGSSTLGQDVTSSGTTLAVATLLEADQGHRVWAASAGPDAMAAEFPFDLRLGSPGGPGGEVVTVSACDAWARDSFGRSVSNSWGNADAGGAWQEAGGAASDRAVDFGVGGILLSSPSGTQRQQTVLGDLADVELFVRVVIHQTSTGAAVLAGVLMRYTGASDYYRARIVAETSGAVSLSVTRGTTQVGSAAVTGYTYAPNSDFYLRARLVGHRVLARTWPTAVAEPRGWQVDQTVASSTIAAGRVGLVASTFDVNTNVLPIVSFDSFVVVTPQRATVTRAVNGVSRAWDAGTDVRLAHPMRIAL